jgi:G:T/U-mismatch repair DNA glycosylase
MPSSAWAAAISRASANNVSTEIIEVHPYGDYFPKGVRSLIIGSFPIGKFSDKRRSSEIKPHELNFYFGGEKNLLWKLIGASFGVELKTKDDVEKLLKAKKMGIGDVIRSCRRKEGGGSDSDLYDIVWNTELVEEMRSRKITKIYFTSKRVQKWFHRLFGRGEFEEVLLISPSAQSARSVVRLPEYKNWKTKNPDKKTFDFILYSYRRIFY